jgi:hypothetical protein
MAFSPASHFLFVETARLRADVHEGNRALSRITECGYAALLDSPCSLASFTFCAAFLSWMRRLAAPNSGIAVHTCRIPAEFTRFSAD